MTRPLARRPRFRAGLTSAAALLAGLGLVGAVAAPAPAVPVTRVPATDSPLTKAPATDSPLTKAPATKAGTAAASFTINGRGFGHGWGMSQYGAYGAAREGLSWQQIMAFYYPGTKVTALPANASIRVKITADSDGNVKVKAAPGLALTDTAGTRVVLPTGKHFVYWKVIRSGSSFRLQTRGLGESYRNYRPTAKLSGARWTFTSTDQMIKILMPDKTQKQVRGSVSAAAFSSTMRTVNTLPFESYLRSVVPMEMPTSWSAQAVRAQAVAARSYAARTKARTAKGSLYDICDSTSCRVYQGYARISSYGTRVNEDRAGNAAVTATAGKVLSYRGTVALTQFASSNGGASAQGDFPYLMARPDPYDGVVGSQAWKRTISAASLARVYPSVGTVEGLKVVERDGSGAWGGRVVKITIVGAKKSVTVSGTSFQYAYGLRSNLFAVS